MAIIPMQMRPPRVKALRPEDRVECEPLPQDVGLTGLLAGTAIVAGCVVGLFFYDAGRPFATGAITTAPTPLVISIEPTRPGDSAALTLVETPRTVAERGPGEGRDAADREQRRPLP